MELLKCFFKVVVVYTHPHSVPKIWFCTSNTEFYSLADDFTAYIRMAIAHLGIPEWQLAFTPQGVSEACLVSCKNCCYGIGKNNKLLSSKELFQVLAPHLLPFGVKSQTLESKSTEEDADSALNEIESDYVLFPKNHATTPSSAVIDFGTPVQSRKQDKKKSGLKYRPPTKVKRKPLYYVKH